MLFLFVLFFSFKYIIVCLFVKSEQKYSILQATKTKKHVFRYKRDEHLSNSRIARCRQTRSYINSQMYIPNLNNVTVILFKNSKCKSVYFLLWTSVHTFKLIYLHTILLYATHVWQNWGILWGSHSSETLVLERPFGDFSPKK